MFYLIERKEHNQTTMNVRVLLFSFAIFITFQSYSQPHGGRPGGGMPPIKSGIMGKVVDKSSGDPVEYANVAVFALPDSTLAGGTITNEKGFFMIKNLKHGKYSMNIKFIGYESYTLRNILINQEQPVIRLKKIELNSSNVKLEGVDVTASQQEVMFKIDKRVVNVSENVNAIGGSAVDALENTPGVEVDIDGNVSLRGSDNFTVLIDGKPTVLEGSEALQQIPASSIKEIELITNPSAKYDPDGLTGIINIILKKDKRGGLNGLVNVSAGNHEHYEAGANLNYRKNNISIIGGYNFRQRMRVGNSLSYYETYVDSIDTYFYRDEDGDRERKRGGHTFKAGVDYNITENDLFSFNAQYMLRDRSRYNDADYLEYNSASPDTLFYDTEGKNTDDEYSYDFTSTYIHKFEQKGHEIQLSATYSAEEETEEDYTKLDTLYQTSDILETLFETTESHQYGTFQADYVQPFGDSKFEAGFKSSVRQIDYNQSEDLKLTDVADAFDNRFVYNEQIHAAYAMLSGPIGQLEYKLGLRGEYSNVTTEQKATNDENINEIYTVYPTAHLSYELNESNKFQVSYSRRVHRPRTYFLNPYESKSDPFLIRKGNPNLEPEYANSYELNYLRYFNKSFISLTLFSRITNNNIGRIQQPIDENTLLLTFENINKETSTGMELSGRHQIVKWFQVNANYSFFRYTITGTAQNGQELDNESINHKLRFNGTLRFGPNSSASLFAMFFSPTVTSQGERDGFYFTGMGYKHLFFDKRLTVSARVRNPFGNFQWKFSSEGENFSNEYIRRPEFPTFVVGLSYRINEGIKRNRGQNGQTQEFSDDMTVD